MLVLTQCLCEAVVVYLSPTIPPPVPPTLASHALSQLPPTGSAISLEVASHRDVVFLLVDLWQLDGDAVRKQWVTGFFAAGLAENGSEVRRVYGYIYSARFCKSLILVRDLGRIECFEVGPLDITHVRITCTLYMYIRTTTTYMIVHTSVHKIKIQFKLGPSIYIPVEDFIHGTIHAGYIRHACMVHVYGHYLLCPL